MLLLWVMTRNDYLKGVKLHEFYCGYVNGKGILVQDVNRVVKKIFQCLGRGRNTLHYLYIYSVHRMC
jgi:hypothetical protein